MKILVTGGQGFIGSALIKKIINETDFKVINLDDLTYSAVKNKSNEVTVFIKNCTEWNEKLLANQNRVTDIPMQMDGKTWITWTMN